ncbi:uncharacterized protein LOC126774881 isoform X1 [Nymphalis io]|uniref:uncharacterized protein LOC126774881 isoform X1 n=2 Tax=Inachis io TaxID=171585 RepID=UPI0021673CA0|nr:uncharacterized protein LOC126774881 isoform X1 [Nymphalis io]
MLSTLLTVSCLYTVITADMTASGIDRTVSDGVTSIGYNVVYGDDDLFVINQVISDSEKSDILRKKTDLNQSIAPLPAEDVKCLMSVDRYCSKTMLEIKSVLIQALKDDCAKCSVKQKESAGKIVASMMAHDPVAWKLFLTRSALQILPEKKPLKKERSKFKIKGDPELIENARNRYTMPGVKVRVKRYAMEKIN